MINAERHGRSIVYSLYDDHVADLLDQAIGHVEQLRPATHTADAHEDPEMEPIH